MKSFEVYRCQLVRERTVQYTSKIGRPIDVVDAAKKLGFTAYAEEVFAVFDIDRKGNIIGYFEVSHGDLNSAQVHPREIYKRAVVNNSSSIILIHNHPSGDPTPSDEDIAVTRRIWEAGEIIGIPVLDHIIIGEENEYVSLKSEGLF